MNAIVAWFEKQAFGVCDSIGNKLGIKSTTIRLYFIYLSFFTFGSPIILYFVLAFLLENKRFFFPQRTARKRIWDL
ncbi:MAG: PspC domain-containing protein [Bacteroidia bacterium]|nr:PspC domain-containing protein [Bacteroidia bacterium]